MATFDELLSDAPTTAAPPAEATGGGSTFADLLADDPQPAPTGGATFADLVADEPAPPSPRAEALETQMLEQAGTQEPPTGAPQLPTGAGFVAKEALKEVGRRTLVPMGKVGAQQIEALGGVADFLVGALGARTGRIRPGEKAGKAIAEFGKESGDILDAISPTKSLIRRDAQGKRKLQLKPLRSAKFWTDAFLNGITQMSGMLTVGSATQAGTKGAALLGATQEAAPMFEQLQRDGMNRQEAAARSVAFGTAVAMLEKFGLDKLFGAKGGGAKALAILSEVLTEQTEQPAQVLAEELGRPGVGIKPLGKKVLGAIVDSVDVIAPTIFGAGAVTLAQPGAAAAEQEAVEPVAPTTLVAPSRPTDPQAAETAGQISGQVFIAQQDVDTADRSTLQRIAGELGINPRGNNKVLRKRVSDVNDAFRQLEQSTNPLEKLAAAVKIGIAQWSETKALRKKDMARRVAQIHEIRKKYEGVEALARGRAVLKGERPTAGRPINEFFEQGERDILMDSARAGLAELPVLKQESAAEAISNIMKGERLRPFELKLLGKALGQDFAHAIADTRTMSSATLNALLQTTGALRTLKTMWDVSAIGRQGAVLGVNHPVLAKRALNKMAQGVFNQENYEALHDAIVSDPRYGMAEEAGLYIAPVDKEGVDLSEREEAFMSDFADKIPGARISERAFNGYLNALRADTFYYFMDKWGDQADIADFRKLAQTINLQTGRGGFMVDPDAPNVGLERFKRTVEAGMPLAALPFFSPRWVLSRIQMPIAAAMPVRDAATGALRWSPANTEAVKNLVSYYGGLAAMLGMAAAAGAEVERDPRSSDFGKIKIGNTRIDLTAGMSQYVRFIAQMMQGQRKVLSDGRIQDIDRERVWYRFLRSKSSPMAGLLASIVFGKTFTGDEFIPTGDEPTSMAIAKALSNRGVPDSVADKVGRTGQIAIRELMPLIIQQTIEGIQADGPFRGLIAGGGEFVGISTSAFEPRTKSRRKARRREARRRR